MTLFGKIRRARAALILLAAPILIGARTSVGPMPETMVPVRVPDIALGEKVTVREGDVVLRAKIYPTEVATVDGPVSVSIARFSQDLVAGTRLDPVIVSEQTRDLTGTSGRIYCGENQRTRSAFGELMLGDMFSKYEVNVRFCFVDSDDDGMLDRVFLGGAKDEEDQLAIEIDPVPFTSRIFARDESKGVLELYVKRLIRKRREDKIEFALRLYREEEAQDFSYILTVEDGSANQTYPTFKTDPKDVPYPSQFSDILGAVVEIHSVDADAGVAEVVAREPFDVQLFKPIMVTVQYIYIYY